MVQTTPCVHSNRLALVQLASTVQQLCKKLRMPIPPLGGLVKPRRGSFETMLNVVPPAVPAVGNRRVSADVVPCWCGDIGADVNAL